MEYVDDGAVSGGTTGVSGVGTPVAMDVDPEGPSGAGVTVFCAT